MMLFEPGLVTFMGLQEKEHRKQQQALMAANRIAASWMLVFERFD